MIEIYEFVGGEDFQYDVVATLEDDGTISGDSDLADHFRRVFGNLTHDPAEYLEAYEIALEYRFNNSVYVTERS